MLHIYILIVEVVRGVKAIFSSMNLLTPCHKCWLHYRVVIACRESQVLRTVGNPNCVFFLNSLTQSVGSDLAVIGSVGQGTCKYVYWVLLYRDYWETRSHHEVSSFSVLRYTNSITVVPTVGMVLS